jgi:hypothetical protein
LFVSLWTPDGERPIRRTPEPRPAPAPPTGSEADLSGIDLGDIDLDQLSPEERAELAAMATEMAEARQRIAETPAALVVANHAMGLYELAAIHLSSQPANLGEAQVAIDAMRAVLDALPGRLGQEEKVLREALSQLQMAFVHLSRPA